MPNVRRQWFRAGFIIGCTVIDPATSALPLISDVSECPLCASCSAARFSPFGPLGIVRADFVGARHTSPRCDGRTNHLARQPLLPRRAELSISLISFTARDADTQVWPGRPIRFRARSQFPSALRQVGRATILERQLPPVGNTRAYPL